MSGKSEEGAKKEEPQKQGFKTRFKIFVKDRENLLFLAILFAAFVIRVYYFFVTSGQALWWDEAEYALMAKHLALGTPAAGWFGARELGFPLILSLFFKTGLGIGTIKFFELLCSLGTIVLTYFLAKELFNKKIALIASVLISFFYLEMFYATRVLINVPATFIVVLGMFLFWKGYKKKNAWLYFISMLLFLLGLFFYSVIFSGLVVVLLFMLIVQRKHIFKNKFFLMSLIPTAISAGLVFSYFYITTGHLFPRLAQIASLPETKGVTPALGNVLDYFAYIPHYLTIPLLIAFIAGLYIFLDLFIGFDLIKESRNVQRTLFLLLWIIVFWVVVSYNTIMSHSEPRYMMQIFPAIFMIVAYGIIKIAEWTSRILPKTAIIILVVLILSGIFLQGAQANELIMGKKDSYLEIKQAGLWIKENTNPGDVVFSTSPPQITFYTEREAYSPNSVDSLEELRAEIIKYGPVYLQISMYEPVKPHVEEYLNQNNFTVAKVFARNQQPVVVIYEIPKSGSEIKQSLLTNL